MTCHKMDRRASVTPAHTHMTQAGPAPAPTWMHQQQAGTDDSEWIRTSPDDPASSPAPTAACGATTGLTEPAT